MPIVRRVSEWIPQRADGDGLNIVILPYEQRADKDLWYVGEDKVIWRVKDVFPVWHSHGGWDPNPGFKWTIPQWARDAYLKPPDHANFCDAGGGDHHIIVSALDKDGRFIVNGSSMIIWWWYDLLTGPIPATPTDTFHTQILNPKGWADMPMAGSGDSCYWPVERQQGPYKLAHFGASDVIYGFGMPGNEHLTFVTVFQAEIQSGSTEPEPPGPDGGTFIEVIDRTLHNTDIVLDSLTLFRESLRELRVMLVGDGQ